jgi:hypothetical protein
MSRIRLISVVFAVAAAILAGPAVAAASADTAPSVVAGTDGTPWGT